MPCPAMKNIFDVAKFITERTGELTAMKLQKLMYYAQAWNMVWEEEPLFADNFHAWANGPTLPALYNHHRGMFKVDASLFQDANSSRLTETEKGNIDKVLAFYGGKTTQYLNNLTQLEAPWIAARDSLQLHDIQPDAVIPQSAIFEY